MNKIKKLICQSTAAAIILSNALPTFAFAEDMVTTDEQTQTTLATATSPQNGEFEKYDTDGNGVIDTLDALGILQYVVGISPLAPAEFDAADTDKNNTVDTVDALNVLKYIVSGQVPSQSAKREDLEITVDYANASITWKAKNGASAYEICGGEGDRIGLLETTDKTTYKFGDVNKYKNYTFKVRAVFEKDGNKSYTKYSNPARVIDFAPVSLKKVENVKCTKPAVNGFNITFDKVNDASGYEICSYDPQSKNYTLITTTKDTSCTVKNLKSANKYYIAVRAIKTVSSSKTFYGAYSDAVNAATAPEKLKLNDSTDTTISWQEVKGVDGYDVYTLKDGKWVFFKDCHKTSFSVDSGSSQKFKIRAYMKNGKFTAFGQFSEEIGTSQKAPSDNPVNPDKPVVSSLKAPKNVECLNPKHDKLEVKWDKADGAESYEIYNYDNNTKKYTKLAETKENDVVLTGLPAGTSYNICIKSIKGGSSSDYSEKVCGATCPNQPSGLKATEKDGKITLTWDKVNGADGYEIFADGKFFKGVNNNSYTFSDKSGSFKVRAYKKNGDFTAIGAFSAEVKASAGSNNNDNKELPQEMWLNTVKMNQKTGRYNGLSACGATCAAMLLNSEKGTNFDKDDFIEYANNNGLADQGNLTSANGGMTAPKVIQLMKHYGYSSKNIYNNNTKPSEQVMKNIAAGKRCIVLARYKFDTSTYSSHFVVVFSYYHNENGTLLFNYSDPLTGGYGTVNASKFDSATTCTFYEPKAIITLD